MRDPVFRLLKTNETNKCFELSYFSRGVQLYDEYIEISLLLSKIDPHGDNWIGHTFPNRESHGAISGYTINFYDESILNAFRILYE